MKKIRHASLILILGLYSFVSIAQHIHDHSELENPKIDINIDINDVRQTLLNAPSETIVRDASTSTIFFEVDLPTGKERLRAIESPLMEPELAVNYPSIKNYIVSNSSGTVTGRINVTNKGMNAVLYSEEGMIFIEPKRNGSLDEHVTYYSDASELRDMGCELIEDSEVIEFENINSSFRTTGNGSTLKVYRIAIASTGEFTQEFGPATVDVNAQINTYLTALNAIFEAELSFRFVLIANNDNIIFSDAATDGLDPNNRTNSAHSVITSTIGSANFDIGHVFYTIDPISGCPGCSSTSGVAGLGVVCRDAFKGRGWTGATGNASLNLFMGTFSHEIGHQFAAAHSYYGTDGNCDQRSVGSGYEPGSGNSLMSYEGTCDSHNITPQVNTMYFHAHSLEQMINYANGYTCNTTMATGNNPPVVTVPADFTIPIGTPFTLTGSATDSDSDPLTYIWEQYDTDNLSLTYPAGAPNDAATSTTAPLFRSFDPSAGGSERTFPQLSDILAGSQTQGEILPMVARTMHFRLTARDNMNTGIGGGIDCEEVAVTVDASMGPFHVTSQNTPFTYIYDGSSTFDITWDVNNTDGSCPNVDILFSSDGGATFPITLASATANDGTHTVLVPNNITTEGRIKVICSTNVFFDINNADITIINGCPGDVSGYSFTPTTNPISATAGDPSLDLALTPDYNIVTTTKTFNVTASDPSMKLTFDDGGCSNPYSNAPHYQSLEFTVSTSGSYTFTRSGTMPTMNLYENSFNASSTCINWLTSNASWNGSNISRSNTMTTTLSVGTTYIVTASGFSTGDVGNYTINFSGAGNILVADVPPSSFDYTYVAVNSSNDIEAINSDSDFRGLPGGTYTIYGLSYYFSENVNAYMGGPFAALQGDLPSTICGDLSSNTVTLNISACSFPNTIPAFGSGNHTATDECTDGTGWTHYWDDVNGVDGDGDDVLLLSVKKNGNDIGAVGDGTFNLGLNAAAGTSIVSSSTAPYVINTDDWIVFNRYWYLNPTTEPTSDVSVRYYYTTDDYNSLEAVIPGMAHTDIYFWKINDVTTTYNGNPAAGHNGVPLATAYNADGFWQYDNGVTASTINWTYQASVFGNPSYHQAEYVVGHFGGGGGGSSDSGQGALPVELLSFNAKKTGTSVLLEWITLSERNSSHFIVERAVNGNEFEWLGRVEAHGNTVDRHNYSMMDYTPSVGVNYYRLTQYDLDGTTETFDPIAVEFSGKKGIVDIYPVPVRKGNLNIKFDSAISSDIEWEIFNAQGQLVVNGNENVNAGLNTFSVKSNRLRNGVYYIRILQGEYAETAKFIVVE